MNMISKTIILTSFLTIALCQSVVSAPGNERTKKQKSEQEVIVVDIEEINLDRDYIDHKIFIDEKSVSVLPNEIKIKRLKKIKNSFIS